MTFVLCVMSFVMLLVSFTIVKSLLIIVQASILYMMFPPLLCVHLIFVLLFVFFYDLMLSNEASMNLE